MYKIEMYGNIVIYDENERKILDFNYDIFFYDKEKKMIVAYKDDYELIILGLEEKVYKVEDEEYVNYYCREFTVLKGKKVIIKR